MEVCDKIFDKWPERSLSIRATDNAGAADAEVVVIATPWDAAAATARSVADHLHRKVVICMSNAIAQVAGEFQPLVPPRGSVSASVQAEVTDAYVAAALHHVPATELGNLDHELASDVLVCSDHQRATETVSEIISGIPGARPLDAGGLSNATAIEAFTAPSRAAIEQSTSNLEEALRLRDLDLALQTAALIGYLRARLHAVASIPALLR